MKFDRIAQQLVEAGRDFYRRGWVLGTSGNFSAVVTREPLEIVITSSGAHKGTLARDRLVHVDRLGRVVSGAGRPSAETALHFCIIQQRAAGAVLHTHSVWSTLLSDRHGIEGEVAIEGYEMLKGLAGVTTHEHREVLPILENTQNYGQLASEVEEVLVRYPQTHGILLRRHGLYTWGRDITEARRHIEILEFLLEVAGRTRQDWS